jgi:uncharacterized protein YcbK (DUF882 family)
MWKDIKHFEPSEFDSRDLPGSGDGMQIEFIRRLDNAREAAGVPFNINSGYRTPEHNRRVGGKPNSSHLRGWAADILTPDLQIRYKILNALIGEGFNRIGIYSTFVHVDCDPSLPAGVVWLG